MVCVVYASLTGNTERFVRKVAKLKPDWHFIKISDGLKLDEKFHLISFTTGIGQVPEIVQDFLDENHQNLLTITACGNMNWGQFFARSGDLIAERYQVPLLMKYELAGSQKLAKEFINKIEEFYGS